MINLAAAILVLGSFGLMLNLLYGVLPPYRDSGDLVASAFSLGIAHPPGYCLYILVTKIGMLIFPFGNYAYRANFLSALWSCLAAGFLFNTLRKFVSSASAFLAVTIWLLSPAVIQLSIVSEMYSLNALLCSMILFFAVSALDEAEEERGTAGSRRFFFLFFILGLGLSNHPTLVFVAPGLLFSWWFSFQNESAGAWKKTFLFFSLFGALGFSLIIFYPVRSFCEPLIDWGNPETARNLWRLITRADYGGLKLHPEESHFFWTIQSFFDQILLFLKAELRELRGWGLILSAAGFLTSWSWDRKRRTAVMALFGISFLISGPLFFLVSNLPVKAQTTLPILEPYLVMANIFLVLWIAAGTEKISSFLGENLLFKRLFFGIIFLAVLLFSNIESHRAEFYAYDYGKNLLRTLPLNSSLYDPDDVTAFAVSYLQTAEDERKDVAVLMTLKTFWGYEQIKKRHGTIVPPGDYKSAQEFIPALLAYQKVQRRPLFSDHAMKFPSDMDCRPVGLLAGAGQVTNIQEFEREQEIARFYVERAGRRSVAVDAHADFFTRHLLSKMSAALNNIGIVEQNHKRFDRAELYFKRALFREPDLSAAWNNLGINFYFKGDYSSAEMIFQEGLKKASEGSSLYYHLALAQKKLGQPLKAKGSLEEALKQNPNDVNLMNELGLIYLDEGKWDEAGRWFESCLNIRNDYATAYYNLGLVYRSQGQRELSARAFEKYLTFSPHAEDASRVRGWIAALRIQ